MGKILTGREAARSWKGLKKEGWGEGQQEKERADLMLMFL